MFTNFISDPGADVRAPVGAAALVSSVQALEKATRLEAVRRDARGNQDNPRIPSGYTYLLQFVAHDMVRTRREFWRDDPPVRVDLRSERLMLNALYGEVGASQFPRVPAGLEIGAMADVGGLAGRCPYRDLPRAPGSGALSGDVRNDDHPIIAQMTACFALLHNALQAICGDFEIARQATRLIYRSVVRNDLMGMILPKPVWDRYAPAGHGFIDQRFAANPDGPLPVEFSHGALRFGHAMLRSKYSLNEKRMLPEHGEVLLSHNLALTALPAAAGRPVGVNWAVNWSYFFPMPGSPPPVNASIRIGPAYQQVLSTPGLLAPDMPELAFPPGSPALMPTGLMQRDLLSGALALPWKLAGLIGRIAGHAHGQAVLPGTLAMGAWEADIRTWLLDHGVAQADANAIAADPPLAFFVLYEAEREALGLTLGPLGGLIIADVMCAALEHGPLAVHVGDDQPARLTALSPSFAPVFANHPITTMPGLIRFVSDRHRLGGAIPGFDR